MKTAFTPGPWHTAGVRGEFVNDPRQMNVCRVNPTVVSDIVRGITMGGGPDSHTPNAALIAAAPEMYEALSDLLIICGEATIPLENSHAVRKMGKLLAACDAARAALAKARGEK